MYNPEQQQQPPPPQPMAPPRMSFSSDFALEPPPPRGPPGRADADFEFSPVGSRPMMAADQLFSKGRILPLREAARAAPTTLRDELRAHDAAGAGATRRGPRWKELLGLKRAPGQPPTLTWILENMLERQQESSVASRKHHLFSAASCNTGA